MKIYLDNCCYNRPFDEQGQLRIQLETQAKLQIQKEIKQGKYELVWSYVMEYENSKNPYEEKKRAILQWKGIATETVFENEKILEYAERLTEKGIKTYDALHIACAVDAGCDCFITTDRKLLTADISEIKVTNPIEFIMNTED